MYTVLLYIQEPIKTLSSLEVKTNISYNYILNFNAKHEHTIENGEVELSVEEKVSDDDIPNTNYVTVNNENIEYTKESYYVKKTKMKKRVKKKLKSNKRKENDILNIKDGEDNTLNVRNSEDTEANKLLPIKDMEIHQNECLEFNQRECLYLKENKENDNCINTKENRCLNSKVTKLDDKNSTEYKLTDENNLKNKFKTIVFSEEELIENREQKRSHPNFKKLPFKCDSCVLGFTRKETFDMHFEKSHSEVILNLLFYIFFILEVFY